MASAEEGRASVGVDIDALVSQNVREMHEKLVDKFDDKEREAVQKRIGAVNEERQTDDLKLQISSSSGVRAGVPLHEESQAGLDLELGLPALPECYKELENLVKIEKHPVYAKALQEWSRKETLLTSRVDRKKSGVADLKNQIYQLIGFFSVFQGVVLTAIAQSNLLHCKNVWSPIVLSVVASTITIFGVVQKLRKTNAFLKTIDSEEQSLKNLVRRLNYLRREGVKSFEFAKVEEDRLQTELPKRRGRGLNPTLFIGVVLIFSVCFPASHWQILCV